MKSGQKTALHSAHASLRYEICRRRASQTRSDFIARTAGDIFHRCREIVTTRFGANGMAVRRTMGLF